MTKRIQLVSIALLLISFSSCNGQQNTCSSKKSCSSASCSKSCSSNSNAKKMTNTTKACNKCGKTTCDASCISNQEKDTLTKGENLNALLPSCNLSNAVLQERKKELREKGIFLKVQKIQELPDGYDFVFNEPKEFSIEILNFINFERSCCTNFSFAIEFEPNNRATHLKIYGSKAIKLELEKGFSELLQIKL
jgi:hypothetical protein